MSCAGGFGDLLFGDVGIHILLNSVQTQSASLMYSDFIFILPLPDPPPDCIKPTFVFMYVVINLRACEQTRRLSWLRRVLVSLLNGGTPRARPHSGFNTPNVR